MAEVQEPQASPEPIIVTEYVKALLQPISSDSHAGTDVSDSSMHSMVCQTFERRDSVNTSVDHSKVQDVFSRADTKVEKGEKDDEDNLSITKKRDSKTVEAIEAARSILLDQSKDFQIAAYLSVWLTELHRYTGLNDGIVLLWKLTEDFWDGSTPKSKKKRGLNMNLAREKMLNFVRKNAPKSEERDVLVSAVEALKLFQRKTMAIMEDRAPILSEMLETLEKLLNSLPPPKIEPPVNTDVAENERADQGTHQQTNPVASNGSKELTQLPRNKGKLVVGNDEKKSEGQESNDLSEVSIDQLRVRILDTMQVWRSSDSASAIPFSVQRAVMWAGIRQKPAPAALSYSPTEERVTYFQDALLLRDVETDLEIITEVESDLKEFPFWLDLQRFSATCLKRQGIEFQEALEEVLYATAQLVHRIPELRTLSFENGIPLADDQTNTWLDEDVLPLFSNDSGQDEGGQSASEQQRKAIYKEASQRLVEKGLTEALLLMRQSQQLGIAPQDRFQTRLYEAMLCLKGQAPSVASNILEELDSHITRHRLEEWDPALAIKVWEQWYQSLKKQIRDEEGGDTSGLQDKMKSLSNRIAQINPIRAVRLFENS